MSTAEFAIVASSIAVVYSVVVPLEDIPGWLERWYVGLAMWRERGGWRAMVANPLGACEKCCAGQLALWSSVAIRGGWDAEALLNHVGAAALAVLFAPPIAHGYRWLKRQI